MIFSFQKPVTFKIQSSEASSFTCLKIRTISPQTVRFLHVIQFSVRGWIVYSCFFWSILGKGRKFLNTMMSLVLCFWHYACSVRAFTCRRAKTIQIRYEWTPVTFITINIYFLRQKKCPFFKNIRILVDRAQQLHVHHVFCTFLYRHCSTST